MNNNKQCSYWTLTINEGAKCFNDISNIVNQLVNDNPNIQYSYIKHNADDIDNNLHYHLVIYFKGSVKRFNTMVSLFEGAHIEQTNAQRYKRCIQYLIHKNNPEKQQYRQNEIVSNIEISELADILNGEGYDFELFQEEKLYDYMNEFYQSENQLNMEQFVKRFGLSAISKYYFVIKDLINNYNDSMTRIKIRQQKMSDLDRAFMKYIHSDSTLRGEWQLMKYHYDYKGDYEDYKNELYMDFVDSVTKYHSIDINKYLNEED